MRIRRCPKGVAEGVLQGIYKYRAAEGGKATVQLFGSGPIFNEALRAQEILAEKFQIQGRRVERHQLQRTCAARLSTPSAGTA